MNNLLGTPYVLWIDTTTATTAERGTPANYKLIACLLSNGIEVANADQDISNKCDEGWSNSLSGMGSWSFPAEGQAVDITELEEATKANYETLLSLAVEKTIFWAKMTNADETTFREGKVRISSYSETAPNEAPYSFTATLTGIGKPFLAPEV